MKKQLNMRLDGYLVDGLRLAAQRQNIKLTTMVEDMVKKYLQTLKPNELKLELMGAQEGDQPSICVLLSTYKESRECQYTGHDQGSGYIWEYVGGEDEPDMSDELRRLYHSPAGDSVLSDLLTNSEERILKA